MAQKVLKVGTSAAVTIPKSSMQELGLRIGDMVKVEVDKKSGTFLVTPAAKVDKKLVDWTDSFVKKYRPALEALAKK